MLHVVQQQQTIGQGASFAAAHLYQRVKSIDRRTRGKSGKQIEPCVISTFQIAKSMGFQGDFRQ